MFNSKILRIIFIFSFALFLFSAMWAEKAQAQAQIVSPTQPQIVGPNAGNAGNVTYYAKDPHDGERDDGSNIARCGKAQEGWGLNSIAQWVGFPMLPMFGNWNDTCVNDIDDTVNLRSFTGSQPSSPVNSTCNICDSGFNCGQDMFQYYTGVMVPFYIPNGPLPSGISVSGLTAEKARCYIDNNSGIPASIGQSPDFQSLDSCNNSFSINYNGSNAFQYGNNTLRCVGLSGGQNEYSQVQLNSVTLQWSAVSYSLNVIKSGSGSGTVTSVPAGSINCGVTCNAPYGNGTTLTLTATPDPNSQFTGWSGDCGGTANCALTMDSDKNVTANFQSTGYNVSGQILLPDGTPANTNGVVIARDSSGKPYQYKILDGTGKYVLNLPGGNYKFYVYVPSSFEEANGVKSISAGEGVSRTIPSTNYNFILPASASTVDLSSNTLLPNGNLIDAYVWAWSDSGGFAETQAVANGSYTLNVAANDTWHIGAGYITGSNFYRLEDTIVSVGANDLAINNIVVSNTQFPVALAVSQSGDPTKNIFANLSDQTVVKVPANAVTGTNLITVNITPTANTPSQSYNDRVVGLAYDIEIRDALGLLITDFNKDLTISLPYSDEKLAEAGVNDEDLRLVYWDTAVGHWIPLTNYVVDRLNNLVIGNINHLTRFAIVAPADTMPPNPPTSVSVTEAGSDGLTLAWFNPAADFHHIKIYRSTNLGVIGSVVFNDIVGSVIMDTGLSSGTTYYYTIRAVDVAGNESINTTQYLGTPGGGAVSAPAANLIRMASDPRVFRIEDNGGAWSPSKKHWIPSVAVFEKLGLNWNGIKIVDQAEFDSYPQAKLLRADGTTIYLLTDFGMIRHVPNPSIFISYGYYWNDVLDIIPDELAAYSKNILIRGQGDFKVYKLENGQKRWIETAEAFLANGFQWGEVAIVNQQELDFYPEGPTIAVAGLSASISCQDSDAQPNDCVAYAGESFSLMNGSIDAQNNIIDSVWSVTGANSYSLDCPISDAVCDFPLSNLISGFYTANLTAKNDVGIEEIASPRDFQIKNDVVADFQCSLDGVNFEDCASITPRSNETIYFSANISTPSEGAAITGWSWSFPATATVIPPLNQSTAQAKFTTESPQISLNIGDNANRNDSIAKTISVDITLNPQWQDTIPK